MAKLSVQTKIRLATMASRAVRLGYRCLGRGPVGEFERGSFRWRLDLREGVDFSIWLLGAYEPELVRAYKPRIQPGQVVLDVGANIGAHTLRFARCVGEAGRVHAFEPTVFAIDKLRANLALNPELAGRVGIHHMFLGEEDSPDAPAEICSSWPLGTQSPEELSEFCGLPRSTGGARTVTLDAFVESEGLERIDLIKLDVDGHEAEVLQGARRAIERFHPRFVVELAPFVPQASGWTFDELTGFFTQRDYEFEDVVTGETLPSAAGALRARIHEGAALNVFATHRGGRPGRKVAVGS